MEDYRQIIENAEPGQIIPIVKRIDVDDPLAFFAKLTDYGRAKNCCLLESREYLAGTTALSFGTARPALYLTGTGADFTIRALSRPGRRMLGYLAAHRERFAFCESIDFAAETITGRIRRCEGTVDEQTRLGATNQMDVLRAVAFAFRLASKPFRVTCGLLGALSYDFVDQFEKLPPSRQDLLGNPDYELYFADNIFLMDHESNQGYVVVNCMITNGDRQAVIAEAQSSFDYYFNMARFDPPKGRRHDAPLPPASTDTIQQEYEDMVEQAKRHILDGDIFQVVLSRTLTEPCPDEPLDVYKRLRELNPSPYMFYLNTPTTILIGSSPELNLRVSGTGPRCVEIRPIAGTKPRGRIDGQIDTDTDFRYEAELKLDRKELAEHMMLVDLARNDIARVANPGSRVVNELLTVEKYESVQHLVSNVKGTLRPNLDALSAYLATMNMGTLTGAPKIEAMKIIRRLEKNKRGYYGGAVMYLTVDGQFDSCITIRSLQVRDRTAYIRVGAGIVHDSVPKTEFEETEHKARSCLRAIRGK
ncbi:MAG TPA: anthranilate synthase component 1 [Sedimentisphaerales bacterium]|jgi:anthranilate synthase component 1|nr:anthranilate synthase component 1 [Sedimentisphaerales bacterium]HNU29743.1 anthranilate synthase component 1 [Sedimentisphaerales bacterium]